MIGVLIYVSTKMGSHTIYASRQDGNSLTSNILSEKSRGDVVSETNEVDDVYDVSFIHRFAAFNDSHKIEWSTSSQDWYFQLEHFGLPHMPVQNLEQAVKKELKARASRFGVHNNVDNYRRQCNVNTNR